MSFVRNSWYVAGWSDSIGEQPLAITIVGDALVLFRTGAGQIGVLEDVCPHRAVPLSLG